MHNVAPKLSDTPGRIRHVGPDLGEHNEDIYQGLLGLDDDAMSSLRLLLATCVMFAIVGAARADDPIVGVWKGTVFGFAEDGNFVLVDTVTGAANPVESSAPRWWGAAVTTAAPVAVPFSL